MNFGITRKVLFPYIIVLRGQLAFETVLKHQPLRCLSSFPESKTGNLLNTVNSDCQVPKRAFAKFSRGKNSGKDGVEEDNENEDVSQEIDLSLLQDVDGNDVKIIKSRLNSLRLDTLLKAGLGISKSKVEVAFYESKIRVNGERILKKSKQMNIGDEVDIIKGYNALNPVFLDVSRVIIISAENSDTEKITVTLKRFKQLVVENYPDPFTRAM